MASPRERMIISTALLIRERGAHSTAISDVLEHSGAPRGSAYHHFPGGRTQLLGEAVDFAAEHVATQMAGATTGFELLDGVVGRFRDALLESDFRAGCPVAAVAVEADNGPVLDRAGAAFTRWHDLIAERLVADGLAEARARELTLFLTSAIEGAVVVARATRDLAPLDSTHRQLAALLHAEMGSTRDDR
ncbi:TetR/AcrR family transcriptional regulator [Mycobacterium yunnanensis]|uniref:TetR/AcrR family transcriptional regulator n=1 Tax=Mycobacterium yunnanensis TaxID=368477 RepID=A0A9X2YIX1_9MYCO|nr:TetR/AcrR family transcriptional regulator [Mycobacterium yunnanensis]MCV7420208.1 TetR/AcrR family transcriptional regulator [Mycobacterium yunnanensis]